MSGQDEKRVAAGLKAAIHNPHVSDAAKERAQDRLENMGGLNDHNTRIRSGGSTNTSGHESNRVLGGYKATLHNPNAGESAKRHAREILEADGYTFEAPEGVTADEHQTRVNAGYKAALNNPRVSQEAKDHAKEYLQARDAL